MENNQMDKLPSENLIKEYLLSLNNSSKIIEITSMYYDVDEVIVFYWNDLIKDVKYIKYDNIFNQIRINKINQIKSKIKKNKFKNLWKFLISKI